MRLGGSRPTQRRPPPTQMQRRKPSKIEVCLDDKEELEEARRSKRSVPSTATVSTLLHQLDPPKDQPPAPSLHRRIGLPSPSKP